MPVPTYILTGFLDAGKTTLIAKTLQQKDSRTLSILVLSFEHGETELSSSESNVTLASYSARRVQSEPEQIAQEISELLSTQIEPFSEIWIEWNGSLPFSLLLSVLLQSALRGRMKIEKVLHIADAKTLPQLLAGTGGLVAEQLAASELIILQNAQSVGETLSLKRLIRQYNPGVPVLSETPEKQLFRAIFHPPLHPITRYTLLAGIAVILAFALGPFLESWGIPVNNIVNAFLGMLLQALPFLLIGVLLSSAIQIFIPRESLERHMPKSLFGGMFFMLLSGLILPVCDCASVPVFRSMVKKGVPLHLAVVFFAASPVINPVVMLSTYYAFGGDWKMVFARAGFGVFIALALGIFYRLHPPKESVLSGGSVISCACGCEDGLESGASRRAKLLAFLRHAQVEFFSVSQYLILGALIASVIQSFSSTLFTAGTGGGLALSILVLMAMAFLLSLCSSSDAVVARGLSSAFPSGAIMAFLVFGPMFDIKNVLMFSAGFKWRFILRFVLLCAALVFSAVFFMYV
ncbi:MAG: permease [Clostridiaceae bacterium]